MAHDASACGSVLPVPLDRSVWADVHAIPVGFVLAGGGLPHDLGRTVVVNALESNRHASGSRVDDAVPLLQVHAHVRGSHDPVSVPDVARSVSTQLPLCHPAASAATGLVRSSTAAILAVVGRRSGTVM